MFLFPCDELYEHPPSASEDKMGISLYMFLTWMNMSVSDYWVSMSIITAFRLVKEEALLLMKNLTICWPTAFLDSRNTIFS